MRNSTFVFDEEVSETGSMESFSSSARWESGVNDVTPTTPKTPETPGSQQDEPVSPVQLPQALVQYDQSGLNEPTQTSTNVNPTAPRNLRPPSNPPTAADWQIYRPIFTQLWVTEGKTLKDTMQIMQDTYQFQATSRMFKKRAADWGLRKYYRRKVSGSASDQPSTQSVSEPLPSVGATGRPPSHKNSRNSDGDVTSVRVSSDKRSTQANELTSVTRQIPSLRRTSSDPDSEDCVAPPNYIDKSAQRQSHILNSSEDSISDSLVTRTSPRMRSRRNLDLVSIARRSVRRSKNHDDEIERYLKKKEPSLSLAKFRTISHDLKVVEAILEQTQHYYDSLTDAQWTQKFPSSPRTVMKEMTLCIDLGQAFPRGEETPIHPTQIFGRYMVAVELLKSKKAKDHREGWRLIHEAFALFKPVLMQQHTQLLRYFFQQIYDYRLNDHPDIRNRIFRLASEMASITLGDQHPITLICRLLPEVEDKDEICVLGWRKSLELIDANLGASSDDSLRSKLALSGDLIEQGKFQEAESLLQRMHKTSGRPPTDYYMRSTLLRLAWLYRIQGRHFEAENLLYEIMRLCRVCELDSRLPDAIYIAAQTNLAQSLCSRTEFSESQVVLQGALDYCISMYGPEHGYTTSVEDELEKMRGKIAELRVD